MILKGHPEQLAAQGDAMSAGRTPDVSFLFSASRAATAASASASQALALTSTSRFWPEAAMTRAAAGQRPVASAIIAAYRRSWRRKLSMIAAAPAQPGSGNADLYGYCMPVVVVRPSDEPAPACFKKAFRRLRAWAGFHSWFLGAAGLTCDARAKLRCITR